MKIKQFNKLTINIKISIKTNLKFKGIKNTYKVKVLKKLN